MSGETGCVPEIDCVSTPSWTVKFKDGLFEWAWTDWLGLIGLILSLVFVAAVIVALVRGRDPLKIADLALRGIVGVVKGRFAKQTIPASRRPKSPRRTG
jgi:hypothetical protein